MNSKNYNQLFYFRIGSRGLDIKKVDNGFVVTKSPSSYPSSVLSHSSSTRFKSGVRSTKNKSDEDSYDDDFYDHVSTEVTHPAISHAWSDSDKTLNDISTQTIQTRGNVI